MKAVHHYLAGMKMDFQNEHILNCLRFSVNGISSSVHCFSSSRKGLALDRWDCISELND